MTLGALRDHPQVSQNHRPISLDFLGFYLPLENERTLVGGIWNISFWGYIGSGLVRTTDRRLETPLDNPTGDFANAGTDLFSFSVIHFLQNRIGQGWFVRGDLGVAHFGFHPHSVWPESLPRFPMRDDWGVGSLIGVGTGVPITRGTRILVSTTYAFRWIEGGTVSNWSLSLGGLF